LEQAKRRQGGEAETARASSTDACARVMKMADGGFRPAYNAQFVSDREAQVVVGVEVSTAGSDMGQLQPMVEQVQGRCGRLLGQWLVDGGYPAHEQIEAVAGRTEVYAPVPEPRAKKDEQGNPVVQDKHAPKAGDSAAVAECVNAQARNRGLIRLPVRGRVKVRCVALLYALAHNLMRTVALAPQLLGLDSRGASALRAAGA